MQLGAEEIADRAQNRALVIQHIGERPNGAVAAQDPDEIEAAQRIDRDDAAGLLGQDFDVTHRRLWVFANGSRAG